MTATHARDVLGRADALVQQLVADFPRENVRTVLLELGDAVHDLGGGHAGLGATDGARPDAARFVVSERF